MSRDSKLRVAVRQFGPFETGLEKIWKAFAAETGSNLELDFVPMDLHPLHEALFESGGLKDGTWDIAQVNTDWMAEAREAGVLENLKPFIADNPPAGFPEAWSPSLLGIQDFGDSILGLPFHDGPEVFIFRKDLFEDEFEQRVFQEQHGRDLRVPETWDEFRQVARFFTRPANNLYGTVFAAYPDGHNTVYDFSLQTWTHGGEMAGPSGRVIVNTEASRAGMEFYREILSDEMAVHPGCRDFDSVKSGFAFAGGSVAMMVNWFGFASMCEVIPESRVKGKVDIAPIPHAPGAQTASLNCYWMYALAAGSPHKELAYDFMRFAVDAANDKLLTLEGAIGCRKSTWTDPGVNETVPYYSRLEALHRNARTLPRKANWASLSEVVDRLVLETINTSRPIQEILDEAQAELDRRQE